MSKLTELLTVLRDYLNPQKYDSVIINDQNMKENVKTSHFFPKMQTDLQVVN